MTFTAFIINTVYRLEFDGIYDQIGSLISRLLSEPNDGYDEMLLQFQFT